MKKTKTLTKAIVIGLTGLMGLTAWADSSLLTTPPETEAQTRARQVLKVPGQTADVILGQLSDGMERLWGAPDPQAVLDALGTKAGAVFALNSAFAQVVANLLTQEGDTARLARLQAILSRIPAHTIHEDGTVTIDPVPVPEPSPTPEE